MWTYDGEIVLESSRCVASYVVEGCSICCCDAKHDEGDDDREKAHVPEPRKRPRRGLVAGVDLHIEQGGT